MELATIGADGDVAQSALAGLGLRDALLGGAPNAEPMDRLIAAIRERETLLILDNCEHVIESAAVFAHRVLGECQRLRILATGRESSASPVRRCGWSSRWPCRRVPPSPGEIEFSPAVRLPAGPGRRGAQGSRGRRPRVVDDGARLPGAGRHAAGDRAGRGPAAHHALAQLARRLDDRFRLLTSGSRTALPRHQTLRAVVDWSWELLTEAERTVLRRLSVFSGGATLDAAEQVCSVIRSSGGKCSSC